MKKYKEENVVKIKEQTKKYREKNDVKLKEKIKNIIICSFKNDIDISNTCVKILFIIQIFIIF